MTTTTPHRPPALDVRGLRKSYGDHTVLDGIDLAVEPGTVHALLGPNGAGKTTVVEICTTLVRPDASEVRVLDHRMADLLDRHAEERFPAVMRLAELLEDPGSTGWTNISRTRARMRLDD